MFLTVCCPPPPSRLSLLFHPSLYLCNRYLSPHTNESNIFPPSHSPPQLSLFSSVYSSSSFFILSSLLSLWWMGLCCYLICLCPKGGKTRLALNANIYSAIISNLFHTHFRISFCLIAALVLVMLTAASYSYTVGFHPLLRLNDLTVHGIVN